MKKVLFFALLAVLLAGFLTWWLAPDAPQTRQVKDLPWQVRPLPDGGSEVFGIRLGQTTLDEASRHLGHVPEFAVFIGAQGPETIEAWFGKIRVGLFDARVLLKARAPEALLQEVARNGGEPEPQPSNTWKRSVSEQDLPRVLALPVAEITYVPSVQYDPDVVRARFGAPSRIVPHDEHSRWWLYPGKGLLLLLDDKQKEVLHYTAPRDFGQLLARVGIDDQAQGTSGAKAAE